MVDDYSFGSVNEDAVDAGVEDSDISKDDVGGVVNVYSVVVESDWDVKNNVALVGNHDIAW